ncbi:DUF5408 family protein [uncultured Helicobacter sp.]|uniref:DUF5408 family protein n=1 Tax=uncultured Helicobacter sp. TaxID=175537 RepID=UPI00262F4977|nr:DUF5408 family protein [uncultured Helicobacter sp.]
MEKTDTQLALNTARRAMKIVVAIGMIALMLLMINIYVMMTQITASAQLSKKLQILEQITQSCCQSTSHNEKNK